MKKKPKLTNKQKAAAGYAQFDNGKSTHADEKRAYNGANDNVKPDSFT